MTTVLDHLRPQLEKVRLPIQSSESLPPACYSDPALLAQERNLLFQRGWIGIGRHDRWKAAGDYTAIDVAGAPVIVLRDKEGALRAYANSCRHRGMQLLAGSGQTSKITCPFHCWSYGLDGRLRAAPHMDRAEGFDKANHGLVPFRVESRAGFVFLAMSDAAGALDDWLGDFEALHAPWSLGDLVTTRRREFDVACNWKTFLEVFNEYYHLPYVHPNSVSGLYGEPDDGDVVSGSYASQFGVTSGSGGVLEEAQDQSFPPIESLAGRNRDGVRYSWVFPNMTFAAGAEGIWAYDVLPLAPDKTRVGMSACFAPETVAQDDFEARVQHYYRRLDDTLAEDIPFLERQQIGLSSPFALQGRFSDLEPSVANFACWYAGQMTGR